MGNRLVDGSLHRDVQGHVSCDLAAFAAIQMNAAYSASCLAAVALVKFVVVDATAAAAVVAGLLDPEMNHLHSLRQTSKLSSFS